MSAPFLKAAETSQKPNILFIMSDEHNASVLGANGNAVVRTPNLDRLAAAGVSFDACYCNSPLCVPSRESFLSGQYISRNGVWGNDCELQQGRLTKAGCRCRTSRPAISTRCRSTTSTCARASRCRTCLRRS